MNIIIKKIFLLFSFFLVLGLFSIEGQSKRHDVQSWEGTLGKHIPVFLHYRVLDQLYIGEVTYQNSPNPVPIPVIGLKNDENKFLLREFDEHGVITGIWVIKPEKKQLSGTWYAPGRSQKQFAIQMKEKDTLLPATSVQKQPRHISGDYFYQYGEKGPQGEFKIKKITKNKIAISGFSVTSAPARNIASIEDTVTLSNHHFIYKIKVNKDWMDKECKIVIKGQFYKDFLQITYLNDNPCQFYFGHNASLEGIFYKTKRE